MYAPQERQRLSENARQFARANYDLKNRVSCVSWIGSPRWPQPECTRRGQRQQNVWLTIVKKYYHYIT